MNLTQSLETELRARGAGACQVLGVEVGCEVGFTVLRSDRAGDLVITADIPLAAEVIDKGAHAINPRGELYSANNIKARLTMRDFMDTLRSSGIDTGGPPALKKSDRKSFADQLDKFLTRYEKQK